MLMYGATVGVMAVECGLLTDCLLLKPWCTWAACGDIFSPAFTVRFGHRKHLSPDLEIAMRYLVLAADYMELSLRDELVGSAQIDQLGLPTSLLEDLRDWNERYQPIIPRDVAERSSSQVSLLIESLDREGLILAGRIANALVEDSKVLYCSEGLLRLLP